MKHLFISFSVLALLFTGCAGTQSPWKAGGLADFSTMTTALKPAGPPATAVAVWEPAVRHADAAPTQRGFGGRVYFYDQEQKKTVKIDGSVVVYAFDEGVQKPSDVTPARSYYFAKDDVKKLHSKSKLGHSYNFWVPWDTAGTEGEVKKISLIVRYVPEKGASVASSPAVAYLPGQKGQTELWAKSQWERNNPASGGIQQVAFRQEIGDSRGPKAEERLVEANEQRPMTMQSSTITVPNALAAQSMMAALAKPGRNESNAETHTKPRTQEIQPVSYERAK